MSKGCSTTLLCLFTTILLLVWGICWLMSPDIEDQYEIPPVKIDVVKLQQPEFLLSEDPEKHLMEALEYYNVKHKDIVWAQAVLETGYFRSRILREYNNLFGLYNSRIGDFYRFDHWSESILGYLKYIQYRYKPPNDYYQFLIEIGYAEDPHYISKLKNIVRKYGQGTSIQRNTQYELQEFTDTTSYFLR